MKAYPDVYLNDVVENQGKLFDLIAQQYPDMDTENFKLKPSESLKGFLPDWIGEFYAYYQWYYNIPRVEVIKKVPISFLKKAYHGLHDLDLELAVQKVGLE